MIALSAAVHPAQAEHFDFTVPVANQTIPDGTLPLGTADTQTPASAINVIQGITLTLNVAGDPTIGGWNGDLYAYVQHVTPGGTGFSVLLNRVGTTGVDRFGYSDSGFSVTFSDAAATDIHNYQTVTVPAAGTPLTGTWQPDARNVDPNTTNVGSVTDLSARTAFLTSGTNAFTGLSAKGGWTIFLADGSGGNAMTLTSWSLDLTGISGPFYWKGQTDGSWSTIGDHISNWAADQAGTPLFALPTATDDVVFSATGAANQNTTLGQNFAINTLTINDTTPVSIGSGVGAPVGGYTLTLSGGANTGITVNDGANLTISANVTLGNLSDTIAVNGTGVATISGVLGGSNGLNKLGTGTLTLSGNNTYTGNTTIDGGKLKITGSVGNGTSTSDFVVGNNNGGTSLEISGGGVVTNGKSTIGNNAGSNNNSVLLDGAASRWNTSATYYLGWNGAGNTMIVSNGAQFTLTNVAGNIDAVVGANGGSNNNKLTITGTGSSFSNVNATNASTLYVGRSGTGNEMDILLGGSVSSFNARIGGGTGNNGLTDNNKVLVDGTGSLWTVGGTLRVGSDGTNTNLTISNGGVVNVTGNTFLGYNAASTGNTALVTGTGSQWNVAALVIGRFGSGAVTVADGGVLSATSITLGQNALSSGTLQIGNGAGAGTVTGSGITTGAGTGTVIFNHTDASYTFAPVISGTTSVQHNGTGTTLLTPANTYSGTTSVNAGTLVATNNGSLGAGDGTLATGTTVASGASLIVANVNIANEALTLNGAGASAGNGALGVSGAGLSPQWGGPVTIASNSTITTNGSTLTFSGGITKNGTTLTFLGSGSGTNVVNINTVGISGAAANSDLIVDSVTMNENVANNYNGPTFIRSTNLAGSGVLNATVADALPTANGRSAVTMDDSGLGGSILNLGASQSVASLAGAASSQATLGANTLTIGFGTAPNTNGTANADFAGVISGTGSLVKDDTSTQILSGANTFTGTATVNGGTLTLNGGAAIADSVAVTVNSPGVLNLGASETIGSLAGTGAVTITANTLTTGFNNTSTTYGGNITGTTGGVTKIGTGTWTLNGAGSNTFTGAFNVNDGTVQLNMSGTDATGQGPLNIGDGVGAAGSAVVQLLQSTEIANGSAVTIRTDGKLDLNNFSDIVGSLAGSGTVTLGTGTLTTGGDNTSTNYAGVISGTGGLIKQGTGTMTLSGVNTFTGPTSVTAGILSLSGGAALSDVTSVTVTNPGALNLVNSETIGSLAGSGNVTLNANTLTTGGNGFTTTYSGVMSGAGGSLTKTGVGTMTLSGANTFTGPVNVNAGTLSLQNGAAIADTVSVTVTTPGTLNLVNSETIGSLAGTGSATLNANTLTTGGNNTSTTFSGVIGGAGGAVVKNGTGAFTVSGTNTYTGGTTLNAGTLALGNMKALGSGNVNVNGGTLMTVGGPRIVDIGSGNFNVNGGTVVALVGGTTPGVNHDQYKTTGTAGFTSTAGTLALVQQNGYLLAPGDKVNLAVATGGVNGGSAGGTPVPSANVTGLAAFSNSPLLVPRVSLYLTTVTLEAIQGSFKALAGQLGFTPNQIAVAGALDSIAAQNQFKTGLIKEINYLDMQSLANLRSDLDKIAPEELTAIFSNAVALANVQSANLERRMEDIRNSGPVTSASGLAATGSGPSYSGNFAGPKGAPSKQIAPAPTNDERWGLFLTGSGEFTRVGSTSNAAGYHFETGGVTGGVDYRVNDHFAIGLDFGYVGTNASLVNGGSIDTDGGRLGIYATYFNNNFHLDAAVNGGLNSYKTKRVTPNNTVATGSPDGSEVNILVSTGYDWKVGKLTIGPTASYQYTNVRLDGFTEAGLFAPLAVAGQTSESSRSSFGFHATYDTHIGSLPIRPEVRVAWQHEFDSTTSTITSRFANLGGNPFTVSGPKVGRDSVVVGAGVSMQWTPRCATYLYYDGEIGRTNYNSHNVSAGFRFQF